MEGIELRFTGKIGKKPELKGEGDKAYTTFGVATEKWVGEGKGDQRDGKATAYKTTWIDCTGFGRSAQFICERFNPGDTIVVSGELDKKTYEKKDKDGNVIDAQALGVRCMIRDFKGPFRAVKNEGGQTTSAPAQNSAPAPSRQAAPAPSRQAAPRQAAPAPRPAAAATAVQDDDIPF